MEHNLAIILAQCQGQRSKVRQSGLHLDSMEVMATIRNRIDSLVAAIQLIDLAVMKWMCSVFG